VSAKAYYVSHRFCVVRAAAAIFPVFGSQPGDERGDKAQPQHAHFSRCKLSRAVGAVRAVCRDCACALGREGGGSSLGNRAQPCTRTGERAQEAWGAGGGSDAGDTLYYLRLAGKRHSCAAAAISCRLQQQQQQQPPPLQPRLPPPPLPPRPLRPLRPKQSPHRAACRVLAPDGSCHVTNSSSAAARRGVVARV
jgi:hypothetical protein